MSEWQRRLRKYWEQYRQDWREYRQEGEEDWQDKESRAVRKGAAARLVVTLFLAVSAVLAVLWGLWLIWVGIPRLTVPAASDADLRDVPAEVKWQAQDNRRKLQNDARTTLLQGLGGLAVLVGATVAFRQLAVAREGQVTERFTRAIEQLGHDNLDVRLGGIYALERIAADSPRDRSTIAEVLTAYIRRHAPWPPTEPGQPPENLAVEDIIPLYRWAPDVQAALTVLGRRERGDEPGLPLDLSNTDLRGARLSKAYLPSAILARARLQRANLAFANLESADLTGAHLHKASLFKTSLVHAGLAGVQLQKTVLVQTDLRRAVLLGTELQEATLRFVDLRLAILEGTQLQGAKLENALLPDVGMHEVQLQGAVSTSGTVWPDWFDWKAAGVTMTGDSPG